MPGRPRLIDVMRSLIPAMLLFAAPLVHAEPVVTIQDSGAADNRIDIVVLGDGYTSSESSRFAVDVESFVVRVFDQEPFGNYKPYFNVHRIEVSSPESGADHPSRGIFRATVFHSTYDCAGIGRLICVDTNAVFDVLDRSVHPDQRDVVIVLVNDPEYGGSGGAIAVASVHSDGLELVLHEVGHSFGLLADEYETSPPTCATAPEPVEPNVTAATSRALIKWRHWIDHSTPVPTIDFNPGVPGLYEGARYCVSGLYRPTADSKMRSLYRPYEQVNVQQLVTRFYNLVAPIERSSPPPGRVVAGPHESIAFQIVKLRPANHALRVRWEVDGQPAGSADAISVDAALLAPGEHDVRVTVEDPTGSVRNDPDGVLLQSLAWTLHVPTPSLPVVTVLTPNGGEVLTSDTPFLVEWEAHDPDGLAGIDVEMSMDGGSFAPVRDCSSLPGTARSCVVLLGGATTRGRVRVTVHDTLGVSAFDVSDAPFTIVARSGSEALPKPWTGVDVGVVGRSGRSTWSSGGIRTVAGGTDVWSTADAFHFVHQRWTGDGDMVARVEQVVKPADAAFAMAGVMFRESLAPGSRHASLVITSSGKAKFRRRLTENGNTRSDGPVEGTTPVPRWLKLSRRGNVFTAYLSEDGLAWTLVYAAQTIAMARTLEVGFLGLRNGGNDLATAHVSGASLLPAGWRSSGVGTEDSRRSAAYQNAAYTLSGAGVDVWSTADAFHFVHRRWTGDGDVVARVEQLVKPADAAFAMAGVMFRESLAPGSRHASLVITSSGKAKFRRRLTENGNTRSDGPVEGTTPVPRWLKLSRRGNVVIAYLSEDGLAWTLVHAAQTIAMAQTLEVGFLALRNGGNDLATAHVSGVSLLPAGWSSTGIGEDAAHRAATYDNASYTLSAAGVEVWSTTDAFHFVHQRWTGDGDVVARVEQLVKPADAAFAMAGVMFRESLAPGSRHASLVITSSGKAKFRRRLTENGTTRSDGPVEGTTPVPRWLKVSRRGDLFAAYVSVDGLAWTAVYSGQRIAMPQTLEVGFFALRNGGSSVATVGVSGVTLVPAPAPTDPMEARQD